MILLLAALQTMAAAGAPLTVRNLDAPFCYASGAERSWRIAPQPLPASLQVRLAVFREGQLLHESAGPEVRFEDLRLSIDRQGVLHVVSQTARRPFDLEVRLLRGTQLVQAQTLHIRPAPPTRPITYYADFGDDLINIFGAGLGSGPPLLHHQIREGGLPARTPPVRTADGRLVYDPQGFDQYFRRLQCQGVAREILWLFPFPFLSNPSVYPRRDWDTYQNQVRAILDSPELTSAVAQSTTHSSWGWLRDLMAFRLDPSLHQALSNSAVAHGITLAVSYRPFEHAGAKYYQLPAFDASGEFLWFFHPLASPTVNFHPDEVGFAHYRALLPDAQPTTIHFDSVRDPAGFLARFRSHRDNLRILAAAFPPVQSDSFVLVRQSDGHFRLRPYREIQAAAEARRLVIRDFDLTYDPRAGIRITGLKIPSQLGFILLDNPSGASPLTLPAREPARLLSPDSTELGRNATFFAMPESSAEATATRIAGITPQGGFHSLFFAAEASLKLDRAAAHHDLLSSVLVIARGEPYSSEMVDFNLPRARGNAVREMRAVLAYPAFREIFVNTRSHTQLVASRADGARGIQPIGAYRENNERYAHLGIDLAYAPRSTVLQREPLSVLTAFQPGEWTAPCLSPTCPHAWRLARNRAVAAGLRLLLQDFRRAFPDTRLRAVLPETAGVAQAAGSTGYATGRNNYIRNIGEGMALLDPPALPGEPVLLGVGAQATPAVLHRFLDAALRAVPAKALMYEGQSTLKDEAGARTREAALCAMLAHPIDEVILYEAADWTYRLPWDGFDFLATCPPRN